MYKVVSETLLFGASEAASSYDINHNAVLLIHRGGSFFSLPCPLFLAPHKNLHFYTCYSGKMLKLVLIHG